MGGLRIKRLKSAKWAVEQGDCLTLMRRMTRNSVDLVFCSPPYDGGWAHGTQKGKFPKGKNWVRWAMPRFQECLRVTRGLVCWVCDSPTERHKWLGTPILFMYELLRRGVCLRKPPLYYRWSTPGSGSRDWLRNNYEFIVCATAKRAKLPWSDNTAMGHPCKFKPGGDFTNRDSSGRRQKKHYNPPELANPGNVVDCGAVGGGNIGDLLAHENEAPFPEHLAEFFVRSFCPPGGTVLDPFMGSGTTLKVAVKHGREAIGFDFRENQIELTKRRMKENGF